MSNVPSDLQYTRTHEWVRHLPDGNVEVGITDHAQRALGDIVFVEIPEAGRQCGLGEAVATVESVKAASEMYTPVACEVVDGNALLSSEPEAVNTEPYGDGWLFRGRPTPGAETDELLDAAGYEEYLRSQGD
ncbi:MULTISPECIES: glycine cleavage system protein GcvH [Streptomyces]|uniref:glycine cleavage system protein GcvH n=1 Tax=Streptomyces TaxID=1883 RepID=UPI0024769136|nr:glycine cleavage system protein GcvH [Streptomyces sp. MAA16]MDH6700833.1 glycine cleavage system H protein [Streptomyces sp. MAA16]